MRNPVSIFGVDYPSQLAAAVSLSVSPSTIHWHLERGTLDRIGKPAKTGTGSARKCCVDDLEYGSLTQAARSQGCTIKRIQRRIRDNDGARYL